MIYYYHYTNRRLFYNLSMSRMIFYLFLIAFFSTCFWVFESLCNDSVSSLGQFSPPPPHHQTAVFYSSYRTLPTSFTNKYRLSGVTNKTTSPHHYLGIVTVINTVIVVPLLFILLLVLFCFHIFFFIDSYTFIGFIIIIIQIIISHNYRYYIILYTYIYFLIETYFCNNV